MSLDFALNCRAIKDKADKTAAMNAFDVWDECAQNAWDRHRWDRPSKDQHDTPELLGNLNLLYDILHKHGERLGFPFPTWVQGAGRRAFLEPARVPVVTPSAPAVPASRPFAAKQPHKRPRGSTGNGRDVRSSRSRMVDDGGHGRDSDAEDSDGCSGDGFLVAEDENQSDSESDRSGQRANSPIKIVSDGEGQNLRAAAGAKRMIIADSDDDSGHDGVGNGPGSSPTGAAQDTLSSGDAAGPENTGGKEDAAALRRKRELTRLAAWSWDSRIKEHPPNEDIYGLASGTRSRREHLTSSQMMAVLGSEEPHAQDAFDAEASPGIPEFPPAEDEGDPSSSDDDMPLLQLANRRMATPAPHAPLPASEPAGESEASPLVNAVPSAQRAANAAQALLGSLYVHLPSPSPPGMAAAEQLPGKLHGVIPDSQEDV